VHPHLKKLLAVQKVDSEVARIQRDLDSLPEEEARRSERLRRAKQAFEVARRALAESQVRSRENEVSIKSADDEVRKLEGRLNIVKNNAEYQATLLQIEAVRKERGGLEEEGLAFLDGLESKRAEVAECGERLAEEEKTFAEFGVEAAKLRSTRETELAQVSRGRDGLVQGIPRELLDKYETIFGVRDGIAVAAVEGQVCTGCYMSISPNDMARLLGSQSIVQCGSCQRLLYLPES
jgi:predicted  nucleic acid-binding Zn-ribbon protein